MMDENTCILVVDDHPIVLHGVSVLLTAAMPAVKTGQAHNGAEALKKAQTHTFQVFVLDVELPDMSGVKLMEALREKQPDAAFIYHTMHDEMWVVKQLMESGADGIVLKSDNVRELISAVEAVLEGDCYFSRQFESFCRSCEQEMVPSDRELGILKGLAKGRSSKDIAEELFISENTVEFHRKRLFRRLGAANMAELLMKAVERGLLLV